MFDLALGLQAAGNEVELFSGYPRAFLDERLRRDAQSRSRWIFADYVRRSVGPEPKNTWWADNIYRDFGHWLDSRLDVQSVDILDALAGTGLEAGRRLTAAGKPWVCNRGSSHILSQVAVLAQEHAHWRIPMPQIAGGLERALAEYEECTAIVVPSQFSRRTFIDRGSAPAKVCVCPFGADLELFRPVPKRDDRFRVIFVGTLSIRKGIGYLLDALRPLVARGACEVWLVGTPSAQAAKIISRRHPEIQMLGPRPRQALSDYYSQASVLVMPSIEEGLALVMAQAMACGVPVIATPNSGAEDLFTDGVEGFIVPARSPSAIRERIEWMLDDPIKRDEMAAAALGRARRIGGWTDYVHQCESMYSALFRRTQASERESHPRATLSAGRQQGSQEAVNI